MGDAVHLLCRALHLAPAQYRQFVLAPDRLRAHVEVMGFMLVADGEYRGVDHSSTVKADFSCVADLAVRMQQFADLQGLSVPLPRDECSIIVRRTGDRW